MRNVPDVAMTANNVWVIYDNSQSGEFGGTSCAAPLWAGFTALMNQRAVAGKQSTVGFVNPAIYQIGLGTNYNADFHDITTGNNTNSSSPNKYYATNGYDLCTGWGTPNGTNLIAALTPGASSITPTLTWTNPTAIIYGTLLSSNQLDAAAIVPGTFAYSPTTGAVLNVGTHVLSVVFTPGDTFDYNSAIGSVDLIVKPAPLTVSADNQGKVYGQTLNFAGTQFMASGLAGTDSVSSVSLSSAGAATNAGVNSYAIAVSNAVGDGGLTNYLITYVPGVLTVNPAPLTVTANNAVRAYGQTNPVFTGTIVGLENNDNITAVYNSAATNGSPPGNYAIVPALVDPGDLETNYNVNLIDGVLTIVAPPAFQTVTQQGGTLTFTWNTTAGQTYQVQYTTNLTQTDWSNLGNAITATNVTTTVSDTNTLVSFPQKFYRIVLLL
jgi:hypothetical protein